MVHAKLRSLAEEFNTRSAALPTIEHYTLFRELLERVFSAGYTAVQFAAAIRRGT
ncbi:hypothetical protein H3V53_30670 [Paraburkholderia bengalensis]|uniref:Uncharacterized protein n=1 Tax=Paraburkholderia bengalensis TaxID=2747562 RepID=A0ABU8J136_9BURK